MFTVCSERLVCLLYEMVLLAAALRLQTLMWSNSLNKELRYRFAGAELNTPCLYAAVIAEIHDVSPVWLQSVAVRILATVGVAQLAPDKMEGLDSC